ncbi:MAG: 30S ribosomal protein S16 [Nitrospirota bacterium]|nr:30S ribosomal protein S16 [Nitrospirota bacterium]NOY83221.1 30S ribosomal protein S16 [Candidatus Manganitrophaceae bacterium]
MAVKIRLARVGRHKRPFYRVVVANIESPRDGKFIEILGTYDPLPENVDVKIQVDRAKYWLSKGALPTDTVKSIFKKSKLFQAPSEQKAS